MRLQDARVRDALDPVPPDWEHRDGFRPAAVLAPVFSRDDRDWLLFTKRRDDLAHHAGQISFPGGGREGDEPPLECALRESREEIGLDPDAVDVLGALPSRLSTAGFWVHVCVGRIPGSMELRADPREVERMLAIPMAELFDSARWEFRAVESRGRTYPKSPHFVQGDDVVWGLTGRLTWDLVQRLRDTGG